jgi:cyclase
MRRERVSDDIYVFTSELYAQVTASAVVTGEGIVVVDTLPFPQETRAMIDFLNRLGRGRIRYLANTHWHGDHTNGNYLFQDVQMVSHQLCAAALVEHGIHTLREAREGAPELEEVRIQSADMTFDQGDMFLHLGGKSMQLMLTPGHSFDSIVVYVKEDRVLVASDTVMPVPYFVWGDREQFVESLEKILELNMDCIVQGHGEVLLRGEIREAINSSIRYLQTIQKKVERIVETKGGPEALRRLDIESCGKSRIPLNGLVQDLHAANVQALYQQMIGKVEPLVV